MIQAQPVQPVVQDDSNGLVKLPEEHQQRRIVVEEYPEYPSMQNQGKKYLIAARVGKILEISISFSPRNLRIFENYPQLNLNWFMPFKPQNFSLILINGTLTLTSKIEDFWGSTSNKIFEEFSKNLKKII